MRYGYQPKQNDTEKVKDTLAGVSFKPIGDNQWY
jgi:hypothetical protein